MKHPIHNSGLSPLFVAGVMIMAGETRHFELDQLPPEFRPKNLDTPPAKEAPKDRLAEIAEMSVKLIIAVLADLTDEELDRLKAIEESDKQRKTLIAAIEEAKLERAVKALEAGKPDEGAGATTPEGTDTPLADGEGTAPASGTAPAPEGNGTPSTPEGTGA